MLHILRYTFNKHAYLQLTTFDDPAKKRSTCHDTFVRYNFENLKWYRRDIYAQIDI